MPFELSQNIKICQLQQGRTVILIESLTYNAMMLLIGLDELEAHTFSYLPQGAGSILGDKQQPPLPYS